MERLNGRIEYSEETMSELEGRAIEDGHSGNRLKTK
jgi:hypothetical protein